MNKMDLAIAQAKEARRQVYLDAKARMALRDKGIVLVKLDNEWYQVPEETKSTLVIVLGLLGTLIGLLLLGSLFPSTVKGR